MSYLRRLLGQNEVILFSTHRHWFVPFSHILGELMLLVLLLVVAMILPQLWPTVRSDLVILVIMALGLIVVLSALIDLLRWRNEQFVVTDRRVLQLEGIISKNLLSSSLEKINDVELRQSWFGRILDYGDLDVLTASEEAVNQMRAIAQPLQFKRAIQDAQARLYEYRDRRSGAGYGTAPDVQMVLEQLAALRDRGILSPAEFEAKKRELLSRI
jgi:uncharacterized membrane protein YdbT with pleckstrin-like domain